MVKICYYEFAYKKYRVKKRRQKKGKMKVETTKKKKVEIRVSEEDYKYLKIAAYSMGQSVSGMLRMISQASINAAKLQVKEGKIKVEDVEALYNDKL